MTIAKSEDIRWIARGLDDSAILLRVHGIEHLADQLDLVRVALSESDTSDADGHQRGTRLRNTG
jgi:hypothetical protein